MKRVLVTGAGGFIGRHCLPLLAGRGYQVHGVSRSPRASGAAAHWHQADLLSGEAEAVLREIRPTHLLHLAWTAVPGKFWTDPENALWCAQSLALARSFIARGGQRMVCAGTCAEYDWSGGRCVEEETALAPATPYATAKHELRGALADLATANGVPLAWGRVFWLFGPHEHPDRLVPSAVRALRNGQPFECLGPQLVRDFLYVEDVASAFVALLDSPQAGPVNIASGDGVSIGALVSRIASLLGVPHLVRTAKAPERQQAAVVIGDPQRLRATGWQPRRDLDAGLAETVRWWNAPPA
jgi:nucleoside-diphosphate-sugar epimerase